MSLNCVRVQGAADLTERIRKFCPDHWVSCIADISCVEFPDKSHTLRVEDRLANELFSHCYYCESNDIRGEVDAILREIGLGLRRKNVRSKSVFGVIYAMVSENGYNPIRQEREVCAPTDKKQSTEDRLRRTNCQMDVVPLEHLVSECKRHPSNFWLTAFSGTDTEEAKKKVVTTTIDGDLATNRFQRALIVAAPDCQQGTLKVTNFCGLGLRNSAVRARNSAGVLVCFFTGGGLPPLPLPAPSAVAAPKRATVEREAASVAEKRRRLAQSAAPPAAPAPTRTVPVSAPSRPAVANAPATTASRPAAVHAQQQARPAPNPNKPVNEALYCVQMDVLERRLGKLLPTLSFHSLSTDSVQQRLEESMGKPRGRFQAFRLQIARIWRQYAETVREAGTEPVQDVD